MTNEALAAIRAVFDERASTYDESDFHRELARAVAGFAHLADVRTVLDVATGTGLVIRALDARASGLELIGNDVSTGMLEIAEAALPRATWLAADASHLPLPDASVDLVTCVTALHIIPDTESTMSEWLRVLRPGGRVVSATFLRDSLRPGQAKYRRFPVDHESYDDIETLRRTLTTQRLKVTRHIEWRSGEMAMLIAESAAIAD